MSKHTKIHYWLVYVLGEAPISWKCKKQDSFSKSSIEAKYCAISTACFEIIWLCSLFSELGNQAKPTPLHVDNTSAIQIATNLVYHERTKHVEVDCHSIWEAYDHWVVSLSHVSTFVQLPNFLTRSLTHQRHNCLVSKLMLLDLPTSI